MARAGASSGAYVVDLGCGQELYASKPDVARMPASVEKLYTTAGALLRYGPRGPLTTTVLVGRAAGRDRRDRRQRRAARRRRPDASTPRRRGRWPRQLAQAGLQARSTGRVIGDESAFDAFRGVPASGFRLTSEVGPLSALSFNRGRTGKSAAVLPGQPGADSPRRRFEQGARAPRA